MITNRDIIIFNDDWGRYPSTLQHIARVLMKHNNRVFWIGSLGLRMPKINLSDFKRAFQKIVKMLAKKDETKLEAELKPVLIFPFVIPFHDFSLVRSLNKFFITKEIKKVLKQNKTDRPILVTSAPVSDNIIGALGESCSVFYCVDDYSSMEGAFKSIPMLEKKLVEKSDIAFAVSEFLINTRKTESKNVYFSPQGVDVEHFRKSKETRDEVKNLSKPVIGFFGLISEWIDTNLIYDAVRFYQDYTFLFIGKTDQDLSRFNGYKNFIYLGPVDYKDLLKYASVIDVGLIPFAINNVTIAANPLKLLEYFSMGIPVVSTNLPEVEKFGGLVYTAKNNDEFIKMIKIAVEENDTEMNKKRIEKAKEFSWEAITENIFDKVLLIESEKSGTGEK